MYRRIDRNLKMPPLLIRRTLITLTYPQHNLNPMMNINILPNSPMMELDSHTPRIRILGINRRPSGLTPWQWDINFKLRIQPTSIPSLQLPQQRMIRRIVQVCVPTSGSRTILEPRKSPGAEHRGY